MHPPFPDDSILARWLSGELNEAELQTLKDRPDFEHLQKIVSNVDQLQSPEYSEQAAWDRLLQAKMQQGTVEKRIQPKRWIYGMVAAIALIIISSWFLFQSPPQHFQTALGQNLDINLPDGSLVLLDESSQLSYVEDWSVERNVELKGAAIFDVEKGKPFSVNFSKGKVEVLGTSFRVDNQNDALNVICYSGKVRVAYNSDTVILNPGDRARSNATKQLELLRSNATEDRQESAGVLRFEKSELQEVFKTIGLHFKVKIAFNDKIQGTFTGSVPINELSSALKTVCIPMGLEYKMNSPKDVSISKKK